RVSRPLQTTQLVSADFISGIDRGHKAWIAGRFDEAIKTLTALVAEAQAPPASASQSQALRDALLKGMIALALSHHRTGDLAEAKVVLLEMIRSFPNTQIPKSIYGPEAFAFYDEVRRAVGREGRGT